MSAEISYNIPALSVIQGLALPSSTSPDIWLGPEILAAQTTEIPPVSRGQVPVELGNLRAEVPAEQLAAFSFSGRSSGAQRGADVERSGATSVMQALTRGSKDQMTIPVVNFSPRPLTIAEGPIAQTFTRRGTYIDGPKLLNHLEEGTIHMSGDEGKDWWLHHDRTGKLVGVGYVLEQPEKQIRESGSPIPIPDSARGNFREQLEPYLQPLQLGDEPAIRIGTTVSEIGFDPGVLGIIEQGVDASTTPAGVRLVNSTHINSILLSANDHWQIRTETTPPYFDNEHTPADLPRRAVVFQFMTVATE